MTRATHNDDARSSGNGHPLVAVVLGTRPEVIKLSTAIAALRATPTLSSCVVFTGQHAELMRDAATVMNVHPDVDLTPLRSGRSMTDVLGHVVSQLGDALSMRPVRCVVVQGDTVSALAGALVSELLDYPLVHVEAGVRSFIRNDPFPEETIRRMISSITERHLCFTEAARSNLLAEGFEAQHIALVPHPLHDRLLELEAAPRPGTSHVLVTLHRRERRQERFISLLGLIAAERAALPTPHWTFIWHPSLDADVGWAKAELHRLGVTVLDPQPPDNFLNMLSQAKLVVTDSAGVSEEAQLLGTPLLVLRVSAETRLDYAPTGPVCMTESPQVASEFISHALERILPETRPVDTRKDLVSSGTAIVAEIERLLSRTVTTAARAEEP